MISKKNQKTLSPSNRYETLHFLCDLLGLLYQHIAQSYFRNQPSDLQFTINFCLIFFLERTYNIPQKNIFWFLLKVTWTVIEQSLQKTEPNKFFKSKYKSESSHMKIKQESCVISFHILDTSKFKIKRVYTLYIRVAKPQLLIL